MSGHDHTAHDHEGAGHGHSHGGRGTPAKRLTTVLCLTAAYMVAEAVGGWWSNSLALIADAGHMFSDVAALALALFAVRMAARMPTPSRSYGFYRSEILAALVNGATLVAISLYIFVEAFRRLTTPPEVQGGLMMGIAAGGLAVNLAGMWILNLGKSGSLNERGAWLHLLTDALGSLGAIVGGFMVWKFGWKEADPIVSIVIGLLVVYSSWGLLKESVAVLMEGAPSNLDVDKVREAILAYPEVLSVHDLHIWSITSGTVCLSMHVCVRDAQSYAAALTGLQGMLSKDFGIAHATIQIEPEGYVEDHAHA